MRTYLYRLDQVYTQDLNQLAVEGIGWDYSPEDADVRISEDEHDPAAFAAYEECRRQSLEKIRAWEVQTHARAVNRSDARTQRQFGIWGSPFVWYDHHNDAHFLSEMETSYVFYALRMVWNHSVPATFRVGSNLRFYPDVPKWHPEYRRKAITELTGEFMKRAPHDEGIREQFCQIIQRTVLIQALGI